MSAITTAGIVITAFAVICLTILLIGLKRALVLTPIDTEHHKRILTITALIFLLWMLIIGALANAQILAAPGLPPRPMFTVFGALIGIILFSFSQTGKQILQATPLHWLVFFQAFRIGVELWFCYAYKIDVLPQIMTFEGANHDIFTGLLAIAAGFYIRRIPKHARTVALVFNIAGLLLLLNTLRAAALSIPSAIQQYPFDERLLLLGQPYFIYLPSVLVVLALGFHILSLRQIALQRNASHYQHATAA